MNIYVGNLAASVTEEQLREAFATMGTVASVKIVRDGSSGESRGFGFVTMPQEEEAKAAVEQMNGHELSGQAIKVEAGRSRTGSPGFGGGRPASRSSGHSGGRPSGEYGGGRPGGRSGGRPGGRSGGRPGGSDRGSSRGRGPM
ncbi:MAG TPA: RNA-binding protein [Sedimentisphaerales bacterium]|nr:RNA-binding protein [Sedimentisphaerales bacterium]HRS11578.1 RNA-binding protein [Sedimentisphaerales bacterium]HRV48170.1 RNA-binding protein [Sedimentisphaerales bacterium]